MKVVSNEYKVKNKDDIKSETNFKNKDNIKMMMTSNLQNEEALEKDYL